MLILIAVAVVYGRSLGFGFVYDDRALLELNTSLGHLGTLPTALVNDLFHFAEGVRASPYWRPVITLSYYVDHRLGGGSPAWFHLHNLLVLAAGGIGLWSVLHERWGNTQAVFWALLYVLHPLQVEVAANIAARTDSYCAAFGIWALVFAHRRPKLSLLFVLLACGSKEVGFVIPLVCWLWWGGKRYAWKGPLTAVVAWISIRAVLVSGWEIEGAGSSWESVLHAGGRSLSLLSQLLVPVRVVHGGLMPTPSVAMDILGWACMLGAAGLAWRWRARHPGISAGVVLMVLPALTAMGLAVGDPRVSQAFLVLPLVGAILSVQVAVERVRSVTVPLGIVVLMSAGIGMTRIDNWATDVLLFEASHRLRPSDADVRLNLARALVDEDAERALSLLAAGFPTDERRQREAAAVEGRALLTLGREAEAVEALLAAVSEEPEGAWATGTVCVLLAGQAREEAEKTCRVAVTLLPEDADVANALGVILGTSGSHKEARDWFERAVSLEPQRSAFRENLEHADSAVGGSEGNSDLRP